jgi:hypothetical protein
MDYKQKYLKYKQKYTILKTQIGKGFGFCVREDVNEVYITYTKPDMDKVPDIDFTIYTTGMSDWGSNSVANKWNSKLRKNILDKLPDDFKVEIIHIDPIYDGETNNHVVNHKEIGKITGELLCQSDKLHQKVYKTTFTTDVNCIKWDYLHAVSNYLVIDSAHIFHYPHKAGYVTLGQAEFKLHALYPGYIGGNATPEGIPEDILCDLVLFNYMNIDGQISLTTYVDNMIEQNNVFDDYDPLSGVRKMCTIIKKELEKYYRDIVGNLRGFDEKINGINAEMFKDIFNKLQLFNKDTIIKEIEDIVHGYITRII